MVDIEIQDGPLGEPRRVVLDGQDVTALLSGFVVSHTNPGHASERRNEPYITMFLNHSRITAAIKAHKDDQVIVQADFTPEQQTLLRLAGWRPPATGQPEPATDALASRAIDTMMSEVMDVNRANGWFDTDREFGDDMALLHSEVSEAYEAYRKGQVLEVTLDPETGEHYNSSSLPAELADIFIRLLDTCARLGIDLTAAYRRKLEYNKKRGYRHGGKKV